MHGASNVAQRFSDALLNLFRQDMDAEEAKYMERSPALSQWIAARDHISVPGKILSQNQKQPPTMFATNDDFGM